MKSMKLPDLCVSLDSNLDPTVLGAALAAWWLVWDPLPQQHERRSRMWNNPEPWDFLFAEEHFLIESLRTFHLSGTAEQLLALRHSDKWPMKKR